MWPEGFEDSSPITTDRRRMTETIYHPDNDGLFVNTNRCSVWSSQEKEEQEDIIDDEIDEGADVDVDVEEEMETRRQTTTNAVPSRISLNYTP
jgi:hypothetical protein